MVDLNQITVTAFFLPVNTLHPAQIVIHLYIWNSVYSRLPVMKFHIPATCH